MKKAKWLLWITPVVLALIFLAPEARAGGRKRLERTYNRKAYTWKRFEKTDRNGDGLLSRGETKAESRPLERELWGNRRFNRTDADRDYQLSREECQDRKQKEKNWWK